MGCNWSGWPDEEVAASEIVMVEVLAGVTTAAGDRQRCRLRNL